MLGDYYKQQYIHFCAFFKMSISYFNPKNKSLNILTFESNTEAFGKKFAWDKKMHHVIRMFIILELTCKVEILIIVF